jgi:hypothetical protein
MTTNTSTKTNAKLKALDDRLRSQRGRIDVLARGTTPGAGPHSAYASQIAALRHRQKESGSDFLQLVRTPFEDAAWQTLHTKVEAAVEALDRELAGLEDELDSRSRAKRS